MERHADDDFRSRTLLNLTAALQRSECEQAKREALLANREALSAYASDKGIGADELERLLRSNHAAAVAYLEDLRQYLCSDEVEQRRYRQQERVASIRFRELHEEPVDAEFEDDPADAPGASFTP